MNKSPLPITPWFKLLWSLISFVEWAWKSVKWRAVASYKIAHWILIDGTSLKDWPGFNNRGELVKWSWDYYREREFPGKRYTIDEVLAMIDQTETVGFISYWMDERGISAELPITYFSSGAEVTLEIK